MVAFSKGAGAVFREMAAAQLAKDDQKFQHFAEQQPKLSGIFVHPDVRSLIQASDRGSRASIERFQRWLDSAEGRLATAQGVIARESARIDHVVGILSNLQTHAGLVAECREFQNQLKQLFSGLFKVSEDFRHYASGFTEHTSLRRSPEDPAEFHGEQVKLGVKQLERTFTKMAKVVSTMSKIYDADREQYAETFVALYAAQTGESLERTRLYYDSAWTPPKLSVEATRLHTVISRDSEYLRETLAVSDGIKATLEALRPLAKKLQEALSRDLLAS